MKIVTHNGKFHTDDVLAVSLLRIVFVDHDLDIIRTRDEKIMAEGDIVLDVGGIYDTHTKRFDHHQIGGAGERENGIKYSSFGLVWKEYGITLCKSPEIAEKIDELLVQPVDANDNGQKISERNNLNVGEFALQSVISSYLPIWSQSNEETFNQGFHEATKFGKGLIERIIAQVTARVEAENAVRKAYEESTDKRVLWLPSYMPWHFLADEAPELLYTVYEDTINHTFAANAVHKQKDSFENRHPFPKEWAGLRDEELARVSGVPDATFCHNGRFIAVAKSREGIQRLIEKSLNT